MKKFLLGALRKIHRLILAFALIFFMLVLLLGLTRPGLWLDVAILKHIVPGTLKVHSIQGRLFDAFQLEGLSYKDEAQTISLQKLSLNWRWQSLFKRELHITSLTLFGLSLTSHQARDKQSQTAPTQLIQYSLPLAVSLDTFSMTQLKVNDAILDSIIGHLDLSQHALLTGEVQVNAFDFQLQNSLKVELIKPYLVSLDTNIQSTKGLNGVLSLKGNYSNYQLELDTTSPRINVRASLKNFQQINAHASWKKIKLPFTGPHPILSKKGRFDLLGSLDDYRYQLSTEINALFNAKIESQGLGDARHMRATHRIHALGGLLKATTAYNWQKPWLNASVSIQDMTLSSLQIPLRQINLSAESQGIDFMHLNSHATLKAYFNEQPLRAQFRQKDSQVDGHIRQSNNSLDIKALLPYRWQVLAKLKSLSALSPALEGLNNQLTVEANIKGPQDGRVDIKLSPGSYENPHLDKPLYIKGAELSLLLNDKHLSSTARLSINGTTWLDFSLSLPKFSLQSMNLANQFIEAKVKTHVTDLKHLTAFFPLLSNVQGQFDATFKAAGSLLNPIVTANLQLAKAGASVKEYGLDIKPISLKAKIIDNTWSIMGQLGIDGQHLSVDGKGLLSPKAQGDLTLKGNNLKLVNTNEYQVSVSPSLKIALSLTQIKINGDVFIPSAQLKPRDFSNTVSLPDDVVFVNQATPDKPINIKSDVNLVLGDNVSLHFMGLSGRIRGQLKIQDDDKQATTASGLLQVVDGKYMAYGQDLTLEQANILFSGGLIDNPGLAIRAVRQFNSSSQMTANQGGYFNFDSSNLGSTDFSANTTVGISITGRAKSPQIKLFSIPNSLSQADILSMLILGQPANQASKADGQLLLTALSSLNLGQGTKGMQLSEQLKKSLGLDIGFERQANYDEASNEVTNTTALVLGKALSSRLYINYSVGLNSVDGGTFTIKYLLNKYFNLAISANNVANGIDVFYHYPSM